VIVSFRIAVPGGKAHAMRLQAHGLSSAFAPKVKSTAWGLGYVPPKKELQTAQDVLPRAIRECFKWLLCPGQENATDPKPHVEAFPLNTSGGSLVSEIERVCLDNELVITTWSPIHLRAKRRSSIGDLGRLLQRR
jgi:hypothetical protein